MKSMLALFNAVKKVTWRGWKFVAGFLQKTALLRNNRSGISVPVRLRWSRV